MGQPRERTPSVLLINPKTDPRQSLDGGRLDRGGGQDTTGVPCDKRVSDQTEEETFIL